MNDDDRRTAAIRRLRAKRDFRRHVGVYVAVNAMLVLVWAATGAGYFWPVWPLLGWGLGLLLHGYTAFAEQPISEEEIRAEMRRP